jgi:hypothetical protein
VHRGQKWPDAEIVDGVGRCLDVFADGLKGGRDSLHAVGTRFICDRENRCWLVKLDIHEAFAVEFADNYRQYHDGQDTFDHFAEVVPDTVIANMSVRASKGKVR